MPPPELNRISGRFPLEQRLLQLNHPEETCALIKGAVNLSYSNRGVLLFGGRERGRLRKAFSSHWLGLSWRASVSSRAMRLFVTE